MREIWIWEVVTAMFTMGMYKSRMMTQFAAPKWDLTWGRSSTKYNVSNVSWIKKIKNMEP